ncbi:MAG: alpha/beta fold hydrolase [Actinobacteria bacterium]|nr:alpha/beta fold hydrolase [Actinomycetota bacterium]
MDVMWWNRTAGGPDIGAPPLPAGRWIELPGRGTIFVRDTGGPSDRPVLLLLHGRAATADLNWWFCYQTLAKRFRVLAVDHRGHGRGMPVRGHFRLADCADDAVAIADALGIERFVPVGYSMGGPIAQLIWHRNPERVEALVLCATSRDFQGSLRDWASFAVTPWLSLAARVVPSSPLLSVTTKLLASRGADEPYAAWMLREFTSGEVPAILEAASALGRFSSREWIGRVDVPVAVVATASDSLVPLRRQVKLALAIPSATLHVTEGDHYLSAADRDGFVTALDDACTLVARRARAGDHRRRSVLAN